MATHGFYTGKDPSEAIKSKRQARNYFYLNGDLYKKIKFHSGRDLMRAWNYTQQRMEELPKAHTLLKAEKTFTLLQAAAMLNRSRMYINHLYMFDYLKRPQKSFPVGSTDRKGVGRYRLSSQDVYDLHDHFASKGYVHLGSSADKGNLNKDSIVKPLPSRRELTAMMKYETITYVKGADGEFKPLFNAPSEEDWL